MARKMEHYLSPSAAERFLACTASIQHQNKFAESKYSVLGDLQHTVGFLRLEQLLKDVDNQKQIDKLTDPNNKYVRNGGTIAVKWDNTCEANVNEYVSYVKKLVKKLKPKIIFLEYRMKFNFYGYQMQGTADVALVLENYDIVVIDFKSGRNAVDVEDNPQMLLYGMGFVQEVRNKLKNTPQNIIISICQPLAQNQKALKYSIEQVADWYRSLSKPMNAIIENRLTYNPTKKACHYCDYRDECMARFEKGVC